MPASVTKMTVLIVNGSADMYGANRIMLQCIEFLSPRKIILIVPGEGLLTQCIREDVKYGHVQIKILPGLPLLYRGMSISDMLALAIKMISFRKVIKELITGHHIDWAYVNTLSCLLTVKPIKSCKIKTLLHVHEILENDGFLTNNINKLAVAWGDKIIAVSDAVKSNLFEISGHLEQKKISTVLNGIEDRYLPSAKKIDSSNNKIIITLFARIKPEKGIWFFLDAIALLSKECREQCVFQIIGGAAPGGESYLEELQKDIKSHSAGTHIRFHSFIPDITNALNESDIIVVPSLMKDPFPTTILEGLSAGKPVIATNTGGATQSVKDKVTGFLIAPNDKRTFAACMSTLIGSPALRIEMGAAARKDFLENFSLQTFENNFMKKIGELESAVFNGS